MELFHGSHKKLKILKPSKGDYLYASPSFNYAICFAGKKWKNNDEISLQINNNRIYLIELKENAFKDIYNTKGYIYVINHPYFKYFKDNEYTVNEYIKPCKRIKINNVYEFLKKSEIVLCHYSSISLF